MRTSTLEWVDKYKIIAIVRGIETQKLLAVADALYAGGIRMMEVTFDQKNPESWKDTAAGIAAIREKYEPSMLVGAGTVTSVALVELAACAGARYIISPDMNPDVIAHTVELDMVSMPGVMTPSEMMVAHRAGADYVKVFPAGTLGADYIKAVRGPISHINMLAVGGINEKNLASFLDAGMSGAGVGGNLVNKKWIDAGEYEKLTAVAKEMMHIAMGGTEV